MNDRVWNVTLQEDRVSLGWSRKGSKKRKHIIRALYIPLPDDLMLATSMNVGDTIKVDVHSTYMTLEVVRDEPA
jgi:hypothetical protein